MKKAVIIFHSKTGITRRYAEETEDYLRSKGLEVTSRSVKSYRKGECDDADYLLLGCWTSGLMIMLQHPDSEWKDFAKDFEGSSQAKTLLFTTYKLLTGSMFRNMLSTVEGKIKTPSAEIKSRTGSLSENDRKILDNFID